MGIYRISYGISYHCDLVRLRLHANSLHHDVFLFLSVLFSLFLYKSFIITLFKYYRIKFNQSIKNLGAIISFRKRYVRVEYFIIYFLPGFLLCLRVFLVVFAGGDLAELI